MTDYSLKSHTDKKRIAALKLWSDPAYREKQRQTRSAQRRAISQAMRDVWQRPEYRERQLPNLFKKKAT